MCSSPSRVLEFRIYGLLLYLVNNDLKKKKPKQRYYTFELLSVEYKKEGIMFVISYTVFLCLICSFKRACRKKCYISEHKQL